MVKQYYLHLDQMSRPQSQCDPADIFQNSQCLQHCQSPAIFTHHRDKRRTRLSPESAEHCWKKNKKKIPHILTLLKNKMLSFLNTTVRACVCLQCLFYADQTKHPKLTSRGLHWVFDGNSLDLFKSSVIFCVKL